MRAARSPLTLLVRARASARMHAQKAPKSARSVVAAALVLALTSTSGVARAADPVAEALYQEARRAMATGDLELACKKFEESAVRESAPGTLLNLGDCQEKRGELVAAKASFEKASASFQPTDTRVSYTRDRLTALEKRIPHITPRSGSPADVTIDGATVPIGVAHPVDPGTHHVVFTPHGAPPRTLDVEIAAGEARDVDAALVGAPLGTGEAPSKAHPDAKGERPHRSTLVRTLTWGAFGLAGAGLVVGTYGGIRALDAKSTVDENCPPGGCNPVGLEAQDDGRTFSTIGTVGFVTAGVGLAAGIALLLFGK